MRPFNIANWPIATVFGILVLIVMMAHGVKIYRLLNSKPIAPAPVNTSPAKG